MFTSNQLTIEKNKLLPYALAICATAAVVYQSVKQPEVVEKTRVKVVTKNVEVVKYKDRIKIIRIVETKPDGTKIETDIRDETSSGSNTKKDETRTDNSSVTLRRLPSYSLSVHCDIRNCSDFRNYQVMGGFRLGQLPLNLELGGGFNGVLIGVRLDF